MEILINLLGWLGVLFLTIQSLPQILKFNNKNYKPITEGKKPFYFLAAASIFGVYYGLLLENKIIHIGVANLASLFLSLLTIAIFISRTNRKNLILYIIIANLIMVTTITSTILFYVFDISYENWILVALFILLTLIPNMIAFLPSTIVSIKKKDMSQVSIFVLFNIFFMNLFWNANWILAKSLNLTPIAYQEIYVFIIVVTFQTFGIIFYAFQIFMWYKYSLNKNVKSVKVV